MASLSEVFAKQLSPQLVDIYWDALKGLFIEQFTQAAQSCIRHNKHFPKPAEIFQLAKERENVAPKAAQPLPARDPKWLGIVNCMFLRYLEKRRLVDEFKGDVNYGERRATCLQLWEFFDALEVEQDPAATEDEMQKRFDAAMARISDVMDVAA